MARVFEKQDFPPRFVELKKQLIDSNPEAQAHLTAAWTDLLTELSTATKKFKEQGSDLVPQVDFADLGTLSQESIANIKKCGCVLIRNVVDREEALGWKQAVKDYVAANPTIPGFPEDNKQFFHMYWSKSQVKARSHPNVLASQDWLNSLYHAPPADQGNPLDTPLVYADRLRIRHPGPTKWLAHLPHIDGGAIERWEDPGFQGVYADILKGNWKAHDPYDLQARLHVNSNIYNRPGQASIFRTFQGWLAMSDTGPNEGTLQVFPNIVLSNSYLILRPFFRPIPSPVSDDPLDPKNWAFDLSTPDFPGIFPEGEYFHGPRLSDESHPHLHVSESMVSVPRVKPGDMVYWHCDLIHSVEADHLGPTDSSVMYIPAVPATAQNLAYLDKQKEHFLRGAPPPDFPQNQGEIGFQYLGNDKDIVDPVGRRAMGLPVPASA
ncbi:DUF1479-domain-containing protein [Gautieria morchelliformis]|nr:DUF1479-domain-containing protein [Gautieria morchelliformis]